MGCADMEAVLFVRCRNPECGKVFETNNPDALYCSPKCKAEAKNAKKEEAVVSNAV